MEKENKQKSFFSAKPDGKHSVLIFFIALIAIIGITFLIWAIALVNSYAARLCSVLLLIVAYTAVAVFAMFLTGQQKQLLPSKNKIWLQILIGVGIAIFLCFLLAYCPYCAERV